MAIWPACVAPSPRATLRSRARNDKDWKPRRLIWTSHQSSSRSLGMPRSRTLMPRSPGRSATSPCSRPWPRDTAWPIPSTGCWTPSVSAKTESRLVMTDSDRPDRHPRLHGRQEQHPISRIGHRACLLLSVDPIGCDDASHHDVNSASRGHGQGPVWSRVTDLTEQVDDLLAATNKVAGTDLGVAKDHLETLPAGPSRPHPAHAGVRTAGGRQHVRTLCVLKQAPPADHGLVRLPNVVVGHPGRGFTLITSRLMNQSGDDRRQARRIETLPDAEAQALSRQQVLLCVEPPEAVALRCHPGTPLGEISQVHQELADAVERTSDRVGPALDRTGDPVSLTAQPPPAFGPARMALALGAPMTGVIAHLPT